MFYIWSGVHLSSIQLIAQLWKWHFMTSLMGKITLYWNREGWFLIFLSIVDKNIKFTTIYSWSKNQLILIKVSNLKIIFVSTYNLRKMSNWRKCQIWRKSQIWRKGRVWQKGQNWQKYHIWGENQIWEKHKISDLSSTSPPCWTKKKF